MPFRWGDYTAMQVDPSDDCTFWYVDEYLQASGYYNWSTHIGSFIFNGCASGAPAVTLAPTSPKWGKVAVGTTTSPKKVILTNSGNATLNITTIAASGDFALATVKATKKVTPCVNGGTVATGATCEIAVTFTPAQTGARTGAVTFTDNAPNSPQQVPLPEPVSNAKLKSSTSGRDFVLPFYLRRAPAPNLRTHPKSVRPSPYPPRMPRNEPRLLSRWGNAGA